MSVTVERAIRRKELLEKIGMCATSQWREEREHRFPARRRLTPGGTVFWLESEVDEWLRTRPVVGGAER